MKKINSYVLIFIIGIVIGALIHYYFFSILQIEVYLKNLIWLTILAGILGGTANYLLNQSNEFSSNDCVKNILYGLVASALVPLFLNMLSSDLISLIRGSEKNPADSYKYLVFFGFCLVAAVSSRAFIQSISERILNQVKRVEEKVDIADKKAEVANKKAEEVKESLEPIVEKETEIDNSESHSESLILENLPENEFNLENKEQKVLQALTSSTTILRSKGGILRDNPGLTPQEIEDSLAELIKKGLAKMRNGKNGSPRWFITQKGRLLLQKKLIK